MRLEAEYIQKLKTYLFYDRKHSSAGHNVQNVESRYKILCNWFGEKEFNRENFTKFMQYLQEKGYSNNTCNNFIKIGKHIDKLFKLNELQDYTYFQKPYVPVDILTADEIERMSEVNIQYGENAKEKNNLYKAIIVTLFLTGARINEILTLKWEDLKKYPVPLLILNQTKINEIRYAAIPQSLHNLLYGLPRYSAYIFSFPDGRAVDRRQVGDDLKRRARACKVRKEVYNHVFRHSFINFMRRSGTPIEVVSRMVGHKSIETTQRHYVHTMVEELSDALHEHHPYLKKKQTFHIIAKRGKHMLQSFIDQDRYGVKVKKNKKKVHFEVHEQ